MRWLAQRPAAWRAAITHATLDTSGPYRNVFDTVLPNAVQVADPFRPVTLTGEKLDLIRRRVQQETSAIGATSLASSCHSTMVKPACLAIAVERDWVFATDDGEALRVLDHVARGHPYERIRKPLIRAAAEGHVTEERANEIHEAMTRAGFWDDSLPFADKRD